MTNRNALLTSAVTGLLALSATAPAPAAEAPKMEKCYGIAKAGKNDCQTVSSACAGTARKDGQKDAWIYLPKGSCERIVGASLSAAKK